MRATLPTHPLRRRRKVPMLRLIIRRSAWRHSTEVSRSWACWALQQLLRDLERGIVPRQALQRARARAHGRIV